MHPPERTLEAVLVVVALRAIRLSAFWAWIRRASTRARPWRGSRRPGSVAVHVCACRPTLRYYSVAMSISTGFAPIARSDARILILGSLPGRTSLEASQYYAHPQNAFWRIMRAVFAIDGGYEDRCKQLTASEIALWDVLKSSARPGSMDSDIRMDSSEPNDFSRFFSDYPSIRRVCFNGKMAESLYRKMVLPGLGGDGPEMSSLPSTSPAYASLSFDDKLAAWREALVR